AGLSEDREEIQREKINTLGGIPQHIPSAGLFPSFHEKKKKRARPPGKGLNSFPEPSGLEEGRQGG
ncbi:MAG TPA: hypothetical protein VF888_02050, partial [Nitrospirota bacterium]